MKNRLKGVGAAMITPFKADMSIDWEALERMINYVIDGGSDYIVALGTTAETPTLSHDERAEVLRFTKQVVAGRCPIVAGAGGNNTAEVIRQLGKMDLEGVDAILSVTPYYNKPSQEGLYRHFEAVAKASPVPVILYNVPGRTGVNMNADTTCRLAQVENIIGIKEASGNFKQIDDIIKNKPANFMVISGDDGITFPLITLGAVGVISVVGNAFPKEFSRMVRLALRGDLEGARRIHYSFVEMIELLFVDGNPAGVKSVLSCMGLINNILRLPLVPTKTTTMEKIQDVLKTLS